MFLLLLLSYSVIIILTHFFQLPFQFLWKVFHHQADADERGEQFIQPIVSSKPDSFFSKGGVLRAPKGDIMKERYYAQAGKTLYAAAHENRVFLAILRF